MTAPIMFADAQLATRDAIIAALPRFGLDASVTMTPPVQATGVPLTRPHVRVRSGAPSRGTASADADVRLTVYDVDEGAAMRFAAQLEAILLAEVSTPAVRSFGAASGPIASTDPDTSRPIAFVAVTARLRPIHLIPHV